MTYAAALLLAGLSSLTAWTVWWRDQRTMDEPQGRESDDLRPTRVGDCPCDQEPGPCRRCDPQTPCDRFGHVMRGRGGSGKVERCLRPHCDHVHVRRTPHDC